MLRVLVEADAPFILDLLNQPSFLQYIGDRKVRTLEDARTYIRNGPLKSIATYGHGLLLVSRREDDAPIGLCGLLKREALPAPDIGYALLPTYWSLGYAREAAAAVLRHAHEGLGIGRVLAITSPDNEASIRLLEGLGFTFERATRLSETEPEVKLFVREATGSAEAAGRAAVAGDRS